MITRPVHYVIADTIAQGLYWHCAPFRKFVAWRLDRPAGFNPTVDERRLTTIMMKLARGQHFITFHDALFLLKLYLKEKAKNEHQSGCNCGRVSPVGGDGSSRSDPDTSPGWTQYASSEGLHERSTLGEDPPREA